MEAAGDIPGAFTILRVPWVRSPGKFHLANYVAVHPKHQIPKDPISCFFFSFDLFSNFLLHLPCTSTLWQRMFLRSERVSFLHLN